LYIVIENRDEVKILQDIKIVYPDIVIVNSICEFKPTVDGLVDAICDYCQHNYYDDGMEQCRIADEKL